MVRAKQGRQEKLQSTHWRRVVKPCPSTLKAQGSARTPSLDTVLAIRALDTEHFGLVVARGGHHNGGIPAGRQGSEVGLGASSIPDHHPQPSSEVLHYPLRPPSLSMDLGLSPTLGPNHKGTQRRAIAAPSTHQGRGQGGACSLVDSEVKDFSRVPSVLADHLPRAGVPEAHSPVQAAGIHHGRALLPQQLHDSRLGQGRPQWGPPASLSPAPCTPNPSWCLPSPQENQTQGPSTSAAQRLRLPFGEAQG